MKVLLLGSTGLLGQAVAPAWRRRGHTVLEAARHNAPIALDIADNDALVAALEAETPDIVVNTAALTDIDACERDPAAAWRINARPLAFLADWSSRTGGRLVHISTDHYYLDGRAAAHDEHAPVMLVNEYARTKYAGEALALTSPHALVLRTSIVGIRRWERPTFAEWAIDVAAHDRPATLFNDAWSSSIDVGTFATAALDMAEAGATGLFNLAASEIYTKEAFLREIARQLDVTLSSAVTGSIGALATRRASQLGLDVGRAERVLGYRLPALEEVVAAVLKQHGERRS
ncbi:MAG: NAD(P)-dependent oxidoreductase [Alphaproteobacteria bacterium HGW-Alphaproteobacteria-11]|nr:MAG: NAD(P)-dependent oxidoreductase [Alphaproteobacteria bacterium HGW-Alphaproteobacteria-11]